MTKPETQGNEVCDDKRNAGCLSDRHPVVRAVEVTDE
jgi:hypothetical protein